MNSANQTFHMTGRLNARPACELPDGHPLAGLRKAPAIKQIEPTTAVPNKFTLEIAVHPRRSFSLTRVTWLVAIRVYDTEIKA